MPTGHCHCGTIRYEVQGEPKWSALCHCGDCRRYAGAPQIHVQAAERIAWMERAHELPAFPRYPGKT